MAFLSLSLSPRLSSSTSQTLSQSFSSSSYSSLSLSPLSPPSFPSAPFLVDTLINTKDDVEVLEKAGVLENHLGASEDAAILFNTICKEVVLGEFTFWNEWREVEKYCNSNSSKNFASWTELKRYYFSSRWALISVIAAFILFSLQAIQTIYTVRSFY
ncbi:hypothetical protein RJ640_023411 [Escallonia rubra]|uniref:Uncharacterized protein n=1 Tax=Escallonia rubra TaxID=112253 RepID=A0AA88QS33_9ASTE|nr:hypothetical protein RJ640_023411 [Escallonia rubra]